MSLYRKGHQQTCDWNNYDHITQHKCFLLPDSIFSLAVVKMKPTEALCVPRKRSTTKICPTHPFPFQFENKLARLVLKSGTQAGFELENPLPQPP